MTEITTLTYTVRGQIDVPWDVQDIQIQRDRYGEPNDTWPLSFTITVRANTEQDAKHTMNQFRQDLAAALAPPDTP